MRYATSTRLITYVPEVDGFPMTYDLEDGSAGRVWRPVGGGVEFWETDPKVVVARETEEEMGLWVNPRTIRFLTHYINSRSLIVACYTAVVREREARWMRPERGYDACGVVPRRHLPQGVYRGVPIHPAYKRIMINALPRFEKARLAA